VTETGAQALAAALAHFADPALSAETQAVLQAFADMSQPVDTNATGYLALRQNALRQLVATSPDYQVC
jgi:hypothetical protein